MCVICIKAIGNRVPPFSMLQNMMKNNPDGAGFMFPAKDGVAIHKGFKQENTLYRVLYRALNDCGYTDARDIPIVFHSRIGTTGAKSGPNSCHPFPVTASEKKLKAHSITERMGMAHNGTFFGCGYDKELSDSQLMIRDYLAPHDWDGLCRMRKILALAFKPSRVVVLNEDGGFLWWGGWETDKETGLMFSNKSYTSDYCKVYTTYTYRDGNYSTTQERDDIPIKVITPTTIAVAAEKLKKHVINVAKDVAGLCTVCGKVQEMYALIGSCRVCRACYDAYYLPLFKRMDIEVIDLNDYADPSQRRIDVMAERWRDKDAANNLR